MHLSAVRYLLASLVFVGLLLAIEGRAALRPEGRALEHTRPQDAALIVATAPVVTVLVLWALGQGRPRGAQLGLTVLAFLGVALVISHGDPSRLGGSSGVWELLVLGGVLGWISYTLGARRFPGFSPLRYTAITASLGTLSVVAITAAATAAGAIDSPAP